MTDAKAPAIGGGMVGEIPNNALSSGHNGSLTRYDSDGKKMEDYSYDRRTPSQPEQPMIPRTTTTRTTPRTRSPARCRTV